MEMGEMEFRQMLRFIWVREQFFSSTSSHFTRYIGTAALMHVYVFLSSSNAAKVVSVERARRNVKLRKAIVATDCIFLRQKLFPLVTNVGGAQDRMELKWLCDDAFPFYPLRVP